MKYTKLFIEKAIEGGWYGKSFSVNFWCTGSHFYEVFLDPSSWRAVGKVEGWERKTIHAHFNYKEEAKVKMHGMIDALWDGKSIEQYLSTLFK